MSDAAWPGPMPLQTMMHRQWDFAFDFVFKVTAPLAKHFAAEGWLARTKASDDHGVTRTAINDLVEVLFERKQVHLALAWSFLAADPARPETIQSFLPQVATLLDKAIDEDIYADAEVNVLRSTMHLWMDAAAGKFTEAKVSIFATVARLTADSRGRDTFERLRASAEKAAVGEEVSDATGLVVMPKDTATKLVAETSEWKNMIGKRLPFVMVKDVYQVRATLHREYPHAAQSIELLTKDLRDGQPVRIKPVILLGDPGAGKSRLVRRLAQLLGASLTRFDAGSSSESISWAGTARGWGNTTPSIPARAVRQSMTPNPMVLIDEIGRAGIGWRAGSLYTALAPYLECETSQRVRDISLDADLDLSFLSYIATANDDTSIPAHIRDRFRVVRVPLPTLDHLRPLARQVMFDLAAENDVDPRWMAPLDADEEAVIAKARARAGFSIRKPQKILNATLEARDAVAMRN
jgi:ATP-dependent Lon protease